MANPPPVYALTHLLCLTCNRVVTVSHVKQSMSCACGTFPLFKLELKTMEPVSNG